METFKKFEEFSGNLSKFGKYFNKFRIKFM